MPSVRGEGAAGSIEHAVIVSCGDELTTGRIADTNAAFVADELGGVGIAVAAVIVVGDEREGIAWAWREAMTQADLVIATGGLGPTADDLMTDTVAGVLNRPLVHDAGVAERIRQIFAASGRTMPSNNLKQAQFPAGAVVIPNPLGTAPGYRVEVGESGQRKHLVVLPGVPREMKRMWQDTVLPWLRAVDGGSRVYMSRTFQTFGLAESGLDERLRGAVDTGDVRVSFRASFPEISVRLTAGGRPAEAEARLAAAAECVRARIAEFVYGEEADTLEATVGRLLRGRCLTIAVAESCTGGLIGHRVTNVPGSSAYFLEGVVCYSDTAKCRILGVQPETLARDGAVSEQTAREMAVGVRRLASSDLGLATTGIAGPDGGTAAKPVGTVCLGLAWEGGVVARRYQLWGTRDWIKLLTSQIALDWVRRHTLGLPVAVSQIAGGRERKRTDAAGG
jgi:nicotinamide-nucleotide amidase